MADSPEAGNRFTGMSIDGLEPFRPFGGSWSGSWRTTQHLAAPAVILPRDHPVPHPRFAFQQIRVESGAGLICGQLIPDNGIPIEKHRVVMDKKAAGENCSRLRR
jgi:hypothetical protein